MTEDSLFPQDTNATDLSPEEREGLIPSYITNRDELNEAEQANILEGRGWAFSRKRDVLNEGFLKTLHERMYGKVWRWAGTYRTTGKNIGVDAYRIGTDLNQLIADVEYQVKHASFPPDEIAARFHHRLTFIHCYPNGNGRHARMAADLLLVQLGEKPFSWGREHLIDPGATRDAYIASLHAADDHNYGPLLEFVRS